MCRSIAPDWIVERVRTVGDGEPGYPVRGRSDARQVLRIGWHNTEPLQCRDHGAAAHRRTVVGVKHETAYIEVVVAADLCNELSGNDCGFSGGILPTDDATAGMVGAGRIRTSDLRYVVAVLYP